MAADARRLFRHRGRLLRARSQERLLVDDVVQAAWAETLEAAFPDGLALLAVGGYGRGELFPYSDIDLCLLVAKMPENRASREAVSAFLRLLWDSGMRLSQSVRTVDECCALHQQNIELNMSLLDRRLLCGDRVLYETLEERLPRFLKGERRELSRHLCRLTRSRYAKHHNTIYRLEPDIKETPGGLRDLHVVRWLAYLQNSDSGHAGAWEVLRELNGGLDSARDFLFSLRCFLHFSGSRDNNRLTFEAQEQMAEQPFTGQAVHGSADRWMRVYFQNVRSVHRAAERWMNRAEERDSRLLTQFQEWRSRLSNAEFTVLHDRVYLRTPQQLEADPEMVLRLFQFCGRHGIRLAWETERRLEAQRPETRNFLCGNRPLWKRVRDILSQPRAALAVRLMHENSVLRDWVPGWDDLECLVLRDFFHHYTVDEHTLVTLEVLEELAASKHKALLHFQELLSETEEPWLLRLALLLHDLGKAHAESQHTVESHRLAELFLDRIQIPARERELVLFLIDSHLLLSSLIVSRDLDDSATMTYLSSQVATAERLKLLAVMTFADISAVNPEAMTSWRLIQLWRVYRLGEQEFTRELSEQRIGASAGESVAEQTPDLIEFIEGFPTRYVRTHSEEAVRGHIRLYQRFLERGIATEIVRKEGVYRLSVIAKDRLFLFASLAGTLSSFGLNILKAEAFANARSTILDTFQFSDPGKSLELNPSELDRLDFTLEKVALGKVDISSLLANRPVPQAPSPRSQVEPAVTFDNETSSHATLCEVVAQDRPALLYDLAAAFSGAGLSIDVVLVDTQAHKAIDVFYVTLDGKKLGADEMDSLRATLLAACQQ